MRTLTVEAAARQAADAAPDVATAIARASGARDEIPVSIITNPRLYLGTNGDASRFSASFYAFLPIFGQHAAAVRAIDQQANAADAQIEVVQLDARLAASLAWIDLWLSERELAVCSEDADRHAQLIAAVRSEGVDGATSEQDIATIEGGAAALQAEFVALGELRRAAAIRLTLFVGAEIGTDTIATVGEPRLPADLSSREELDAQVANHPLVVRARAAVAAAQAAVARDRRARLPLVGFQLGTSFPRGTSPHPSDFTAQLLIDVPVTARALSSRSDAVRRSAVAELAATESLVQTRIASAMAELLAARARYEARSSSTLVHHAREAESLALEAYRSGAQNLATTLGTEQTLSDAMLGHARSTAALARAYAAFEHALGRPL